MNKTSQRLAGDDDRVTPTLPAPWPGDRVGGAAAEVQAACRFADRVRAVDRQARRAGRSLPTPGETRHVIEEFWLFIDVLARSQDSADPNCLPQLKAEVRQVVNPWMLRSRYFARAFLKPHGFPGDFRMIEWMYDLEDDPCLDPTQPAIVNILDALFADLDAIRAVWHRRAWYRDQIIAMCQRLDRPIRVLDVACGGSRYTRDAIESHTGRIRLAAIDQDPAAIAFTGSWLPAQARDPAGLLCAPIHRLPELVPRPAQAEAQFDLVLSTGLFDYLDDQSATALLDHMLDLTRPGGITAICNVSPGDRSRLVEDWIGDWKLIYRDPSAVEALFPSRARSRLRTSTSPVGGLVYTMATQSHTSLCQESSIT